MRILLTGLLLGVIPVFPLTGSEVKETAQFARAYARAKTEVEKRSVCIDAIDAGVIRMGTSVQVTKQVFGKDFDEFGVDSRSNRLGIVHFVPPWRSTNAMVSDVYRGWYLSVSYTSEGTILSYHLTNVGKESAMAVAPDKEKTRKKDIGLPVPRVTPNNSNKQK